MVSDDLYRVIEDPPRTLPENCHIARLAPCTTQSYLPGFLQALHLARPKATSPFFCNTCTLNFKNIRKLVPLKVMNYTSLPKQIAFLEYYCFFLWRLQYSSSWCDTIIFCSERGHLACPALRAPRRRRKFLGLHIILDQFLIIFE